MAVINSPLVSFTFAALRAANARVDFVERLFRVATLREPTVRPDEFSCIIVRWRGYGIEPDRINCMANYAVLSQADNDAIGDENPKVVYDAMKGKTKDYADEQLFFILAEKRDWVAAYEAFLTARAGALAERLNMFLKLG